MPALGAYLSPQLGTGYAPVAEHDDGYFLGHRRGQFPEQFHHGVHPGPALGGPVDAPGHGNGATPVDHADDDGGGLVAFERGINGHRPAGRNRRVQDRAVVMHAEINCLFNVGKDVEDFRGMTIYSTLMPCNMCAGAIVQFGITRVVAAESENFPERNGLELLQRHGVEVVDLDQGDAKDLLREFIEQHPKVWNRDIGR